MAKSAGCCAPQQWRRRRLAVIAGALFRAGRTSAREIIAPDQGRGEAKRHAITCPMGGAGAAKLCRLCRLRHRRHSPPQPLATACVWLIPFPGLTEGGRSPTVVRPSPARRVFPRWTDVRLAVGAERFRKRYPRLRHQKENLRRNRQPQRPRRSRHHAGSGKNLHEAQIIILRLLGRSPRPARHPNPAPRRTDPIRAILTPNNSPGNLPRLLGWGTWIRTWEWRNQNPQKHTDMYSIILVLTATIGATFSHVSAFRPQALATASFFALRASSSSNVSPACSKIAFCPVIN
jgi:hypothetical protein